MAVKMKDRLVSKVLLLVLKTLMGTKHFRYFFPQRIYFQWVSEQAVEMAKWTGHATS